MNLGIFILNIMPRWFADSILLKKKGGHDPSLTRWFDPTPKARPPWCLADSPSSALALWVEKSTASISQSLSADLHYWDCVRVPVSGGGRQGLAGWPGVYIHCCVLCQNLSLKFWGTNFQFCAIIIICQPTGCRWFFNFDSHQIVNFDRVLFSLRFATLYPPSSQQLAQLQLRERCKKNRKKTNKC